MWSIKEILKGFKLVFGLRINFHKSKPYDINLSPYFVQAAASFVACKFEGRNFNFLGIPVGSNPRRIATWKPLLVRIKNIFLVWKARLLSQGGKITLIKSVLSNLPIILLSFFKSPMKVWKDIERIQRDFFWGSSIGKRRIH